MRERSHLSSTQGDMGSDRSKSGSFPYLHNVEMESKSEKRMFVFNIPTGFNNTAQGCGIPLHWGIDTHPILITPTGLRHFC
jgi:hypothetical protein